MSARKRRGDDTNAFAGIEIDDEVQGLSIEEAANRGYGIAQLGNSKGKPLRIDKDGNMSFGKFELTAVGFQKPQNVRPHEWEQLATMLFALEGTLQWLIGDFLIHEDHWGDTEKIAAEFNREVTTLYDYKKVAKGVEFKVRTLNLSFGHHKIVVSLEPELQKKWLNYAIDNAWSVSQLRKAIKCLRAGLSDEQIMQVVNEGTPIQEKQHKLSQRISEPLRKVERVKADDLASIEQALDAIDMLFQILKGEQRSLVERYKTLEQRKNQE